MANPENRYGTAVYGTGRYGPRFYALETSDSSAAMSLTLGLYPPVDVAVGGLTIAIDLTQQEIDFSVAGDASATFTFKRLIQLGTPPARASTMNAIAGLTAAPAGTSMLLGVTGTASGGASSTANFTTAAVSFIGEQDLSRLLTVAAPATRSITLAAPSSRTLTVV